MNLSRLLPLAFILLLASCATHAQWVEIGGKRYQVEIADNNETRARGLMFRDELPIDHGMLFIHDTEAPQSYWMKNTRIPLDILYFDNQRKLVSQQRDVPPCSAGNTCPSYPSYRAARYVLELNAGQAAQLKLENGTELRLAPSINAPAVP